MLVWLVTVEYDAYEQRSTEIIGIYDAIDKALEAANTDLATHPDYISKPWALDDTGHTLYFDRTFINEYIDQQQTDRDFGFYTVKEMPVL